MLWVTAKLDPLLYVGCVYLTILYQRTPGFVCLGIHSLQFGRPDIRVPAWGGFQHQQTQDHMGDPAFHMLEGQLVRATRIGIFYKHISITILDIIFYLKHDISETGICLRLQAKPKKLSPIRRASLSQGTSNNTNRINKVKTTQTTSKS
jgi:hypothetical protein